MLPLPDDPCTTDRSNALAIFRGYQDADIPKLIGRMERGEVSIVLKYDILEFLNYFSGRIHLLIRDENITNIDPDIYSFFRILGDRYVLNNNLGAALYSARNITHNVIKILESREISHSHE